MKKYFQFFVLVFLLTGCHLSKFPIDESPAVKIDARLLGNWSDKTKDGDQYILSRKNDYQYNVLIKEKKGKKADKPETYIAYLSTVNSSTFLNVHGKDDDSGDRYLFIRILDLDANGKKMKMTSVADTTMEDLNSSLEVRSYITKNMDNPAFYHDTTWFYKVK